MKAEKREEIKHHASDMGESLNVFVNRAIDETMERDRIAAAPGVPVGES